MLTDAQLYQIVLGSLSVAFLACAALFVRKEVNVRGDPWYAPVILIMIWVTYQHLQKVQ